MKLLFSALALASLSTLSHAESLSCLSAISAYDQSSSEVEFNGNREIALQACTAEVAKYPAAQKIAAPLLKGCESLEESSGGGDTGPHLVDSCKVDAFRYVVNFE